MYTFLVAVALLGIAMGQNPSYHFFIDNTTPERFIAHLVRDSPGVLTGYSTSIGKNGVLNCYDVPPNDCDYNEVLKHRNDTIFESTFGSTEDSGIFAEIPEGGVKFESFCCANYNSVATVYYE